jgi:hypothetical protein
MRKLVTVGMVLVGMVGIFGTASANPGRADSFHRDFVRVEARPVILRRPVIDIAPVCNVDLRFRRDFRDFHCRR